jgi:hypothetical protein
VIHHQLETEIFMIYNLLKKSLELASSPALNPVERARLLAATDTDKWRKKFFLVFSRERGTLDLTLNPQAPLELKNLTLNP